jgi:hypothetical protein
VRSVHGFAILGLSLLAACSGGSFGPDARAPGTGGDGGPQDEPPAESTPESPPREAAADVADADTRDVVEGGTPDAGRCVSTYDHATIALQGPNGGQLSCATASLDAGLVPTTTTWIGTVTASDATSLVVQTCEADAGASDAGGADADATHADAADAGCGSLRIEAHAPGLDLSGFPRVRVRVKAQFGRFYQCQQALEITTVEPTYAMNPQGPPGQLILAVVDGNGTAFADSPYTVEHVPLGCDVDGGSYGNLVGADDYAFDFRGTNVTVAPLRVYMGETAGWTTGLNHFTVRNLRSFQSSATDDFWNWAYTIHADPK